MIPAPHDMYARYRTDKGELHMKIVAFDDEGHALVMDCESGTLVVASKLPGFFQTCDAYDGPTFTALIPANGWIAEHTNDDGTKTTQPVLAWALTAYGFVAPLCIDDEGMVNEIDTDEHQIRWDPFATAKNNEQTH